MAGQAVSLDVDVDHVEEVLIGDRWWKVEDDSFEVDEYTFTYQGRRLTIENPVPGYRFTVKLPVGMQLAPTYVKMILAGPLSAITAVRYPKFRNQSTDSSDP